MEIPMRLTVVLPHSPQDYFARTLREFSGSPLVQKIIVVNNGGYVASHPKCQSVQASSLTAGALINQITEKLDTDYLLFVNQAQEITLGQAALERFTGIATRPSPIRASRRSCWRTSITSGRWFRFTTGSSA